MRKTFRGYYRPTQEQLRALWEDCIFTFDASSLLSLYRYTSETQSKFLETQTRLRERLWLSHQTAQEYHANRLGVIYKQIKAHEDLKDCLDKFVNSLEQFKQFPFIEIIPIQKILREAVEKSKSTLRDVTEVHPALLDKDHLCDELTELFADKVGQPFSSEELTAVYAQGAKRYDRQIPPGFRDSEKPDPERYGDFIMWKQIIAFAKSHKQPMVLVIDDAKEDWWLKVEKRTFGPRPELIQEIFQETGIAFHMYSSDQFMQHAQQFLKVKETKAAVSEIKEIRRRDESSMRDAALAAVAFSELERAAADRDAALAAWGYTPSAVSEFARIAAGKESILAAAARAIPYPISQLARFAADREAAMSAAARVASFPISQLARFAADRDAAMSAAARVASMQTHIESRFAKTSADQPLVSQSDQTASNPQHLTPSPESAVSSSEEPVSENQTDHAAPS